MSMETVESPSSETPIVLTPDFVGDGGEAKSDSPRDNNLPLIDAGAGGDSGQMVEEEWGQSSVAFLEDGGEAGDNNLPHAVQNFSIHQQAKDGVEEQIKVDKSLAASIDSQQSQNDQETKNRSVPFIKYLYSVRDYLGKDKKNLLGRHAGENNYDVFISYAWQEENPSVHKKRQAFLKRLEMNLQEAGLNVFFDLSDMASRMRERMEESVRQSGIILSICNPHLKETLKISREGNVAFEVERVRDRINNGELEAVLPLLCEGNEENALPDEIQGCPHQDIRLVFSTFDEFDPFKKEYMEWVVDHLIPRITQNLGLPAEDPWLLSLSELFHARQKKDRSSIEHKDQHNVEELLSKNFPDSKPEQRSEHNLQAFESTLKRLAETAKLQRAFSVVNAADAKDESSNLELLLVYPSDEVNKDHHFADWIKKFRQHLQNAGFTTKDWLGDKSDLPPDFQTVVMLCTPTLKETIDEGFDDLQSGWFQMRQRVMQPGFTCHPIVYKGSYRSSVPDWKRNYHGQAREDFLARNVNGASLALDSKSTLDSERYYSLMLDAQPQGLLRTLTPYSKDNDCCFDTLTEHFKLMREGFATEKSEQIFSQLKSPEKFSAASLPSAGIKAISIGSSKGPVVPRKNIGPRSISANKPLADDGGEIKGDSSEEIEHARDGGNSQFPEPFQLSSKADESFADYYNRLDERQKILKLKKEIDKDEEKSAELAELHVEREEIQAYKKSLCDAARKRIADVISKESVALGLEAFREDLIQIIELSRMQEGEIITSILGCLVKKPPFDVEKRALQIQAIKAVLLNMHEDFYKTHHFALDKVIHFLQTQLAEAIESDVEQNRYGLIDLIDTLRLTVLIINMAGMRALSDNNYAKLSTLVSFLGKNENQLISHHAQMLAQSLLRINQLQDVTWKKRCLHAYKVLSGVLMLAQGAVGGDIDGVESGFARVSEGIEFKDKKEALWHQAVCDLELELKGSLQSVKEFKRFIEISKKVIAQRAVKDPLKNSLKNSLKNPPEEWLKGVFYLIQNVVLDSSIRSDVRQEAINTLKEIYVEPKGWSINLGGRWHGSSNALHARLCKEILETLFTFTSEKVADQDLKKLANAARLELHESGGKNEVSREFVLEEKEERGGKKGKRGKKQRHSDSREVDAVLEGLLTHTPYFVQMSAEDKKQVSNQLFGIWRSGARSSASSPKSSIQPQMDERDEDRKEELPKRENPATLEGVYPPHALQENGCETPLMAQGLKPPLLSPEVKGEILLLMERSVLENNAGPVKDEADDHFYEVLTSELERINHIFLEDGVPEGAQPASALKRRLSELRDPAWEKEDVDIRSVVRALDITLAISENGQCTYHFYDRDDQYRQTNNEGDVDKGTETNGNILRLVHKDGGYSIAKPERAVEPQINLSKLSSLLDKHAAWEKLAQQQPNAQGQRMKQHLRTQIDSEIEDLFQTGNGEENKGNNDEEDLHSGAEEGFNFSLLLKLTRELHALMTLKDMGFAGGLGEVVDKTCAQVNTKIKKIGGSLARDRGAADAGVEGGNEDEDDLLLGDGGSSLLRDPNFVPLIKLVSELNAVSSLINRLKSDGSPIPDALHGRASELTTEIKRFGDKLEIAFSLASSGDSKAENDGGNLSGANSRMGSPVSDDIPDGPEEDLANDGGTNGENNRGPKSKPVPANNWRGRAALAVVIGVVWSWFASKSEDKREKKTPLEEVRQLLNDSYRQSPSVSGIKLLSYDASFPQEKFVPISLELDSHRIDAEDIFEKNSVVVVSADPGYGKSTWLTHATFLWNQSRLWNDKFDLLFFIPLPDLVRYYEDQIQKGNGLTVADAVTEFCLTSESVRNAEGYDRHSVRSTLKESGIDIDQLLSIHGNRTLFVLDAYDEVHTKLSDEKLAKAVEEFFKKQNVLITTRIYNQNTLILHEGLEERKRTVISITGFDSEIRIAEYVNSFFDLVEKDEFQGSNFEESRQKFESSFLKMISSNDRLRDFATKPLYLQFICNVWYDSFKKRKKYEDALHNTNDPAPEKPPAQLNYSTTAIYREIIISMSRRFLIKEGVATPKYINDLTDIQILGHEKIKPVLGFLKEFAMDRSGGRNGEQLAADYAEKVNLLIMPLRHNIFGLGLISGDRCSTGSGCIYRFLHPSFKEFFEAWGVAGRLTAGEEPSILLSKYALKSDRAKWFAEYGRNEVWQLPSIAGILWKEGRELPLKTFLNFLLSKENTNLSFFGSNNIDKYTLPLAIMLFEEIVDAEESGYEWLNTIKADILALAREKIDSLREEYPAQLDAETNCFIGAVKRATRMGREIITKTKLASVVGDGFKNLSEIKMIRDLEYFNEQIIQSLVKALSKPNLREDAKSALIHAKVKKEVIKDVLYEEKDTEVVKAKASVRLELGYVDETFFAGVKEKARADESSCKLAVTVMGVIAAKYKKEEIFDELLDLLDRHLTCINTIQDVLFSLRYFDEPNKLGSFGKKIAKLLEKGDSDFVVSYLKMLDDPDLSLQEIMSEGGDLFKRVEELLDEKNDLDIIKAALSLIAKGGTTPRFLDILIKYSRFTIGGEAGPVSHIRKIAIEGLSKFQSVDHADQIVDCLRERLSDVGEIDSNRVAARKVISNLENGDDIKVNLVLLNNFLSAPAEERESIAKKIRPTEINHEISEQLKVILEDHEKNRESGANKVIITKLISSTTQESIQGLLKDKDSFIYDLPEAAFFDGKIAIAFCNIILAEESLDLVNRAKDAFSNLITRSREKLYDKMSSPANRVVFLKTLFALDDRRQLLCSSNILFVLIKLLETDFEDQVDVPPHSKKTICGILDKWYQQESNFTKSLTHLKEDKNLRLFDQIELYYKSWLGSSLYGEIKPYLHQAPPSTSSAMHSRPLPVWTKPFSAVGNLIGQAFEQVKTVSSGFVGVVDDVRSYLLAEPALISPVATQPETGSGQTYDNENQAEDNSTSGRAFTRHGSFFRPVLSYGEVAQVAFPVLNKLSERYELFGYKPLSEEEVEQYEVQHSEELEEIEASLEEMEGHPILERRLEYRIAQEAFEQAKLCFRNSFEDPLAQDGKVTESEHEKVVQTIDRAQQAVMTLEALKVQSEKFSQELEKIMYVQDHIREELQKIRLDFEDQIKQLRREQRAMAPIESEWDRLEEDICQMQKAYEDKEPLYNAMDYLLGKIDQQLEIGSLNDQLPVIQNQLNLLAGAMQEITTNAFDVESGLAANVIAAADKWRSGELMKSHVAQADKTLRPENHRRSSVLTDFFAVPSTRDRLPVSVTSSVTGPTQPALGLRRD